jgi:hypothetical protein
MLFWIILIGLNLAYWVARELQHSRSARIEYAGIEQLFFFSVVFFVLSFFGVPIMNFKSDEIITVSDPQYSKVRFGALVLLCIAAFIHFFLIYLQNRKRRK